MPCEALCLPSSNNQADLMVRRMGSKGRPPARGRPFSDSLACSFCMVSARVLGSNLLTSRPSTSAPFPSKLFLAMTCRLPRRAVA